MANKITTQQIVELANSPQLSQQRENLGINRPITATDLDVTAAAASTSNNEFLAAMVNLIAKSYAFSVWKFDLPYMSFELSKNPYGDGEIFTVTDIAESATYSETESPWDTTTGKPTVVQTIIKTVEKKRIKRIINNAILKGTQLSEGEAFTSLINVLLEGINNAYKFDLWKIIGAEIKGTDTNGNGPAQTLKASDVYAAYDATKPEDKALVIKNVMSKMKYPGTEFVIGNKINNATPISEQVIVMNDTMANEIGVKGYAYMYNQDQAQFAKPIFDIQIPDNMVLIGNPKAYVWDLRINEATSLFNPASLDTTYWLHYWIRHGFIEGVQFIAVDFT